jgi:hypothetical protein
MIDPTGNSGGGLGICRRRQQDREFIPTQTSDYVVPAQRLLQARREIAQDQVTDPVAESVIDLLESVEVEKKQGKGVARALDINCNLRNPVEQKRAIRQAGQTIVEGLAGELLVGLASRDVPDNCNPHPDAFDLTGGRRDFHRELTPIISSGKELT